MIKFLRGGVAVLDNTRVVRNLPIAFRLTKELQDRIKLRKVQEIARRNQAVIYDADKAKYYLNMLNFYNNNFFGYGVFGNQTHYNPSKEEDLLKILSNFNYAKDNVRNLGETLITTGIGSSFKGVLPAISKRRTVGLLSSLTPYKIGEGAEALVIRNSPTTVGKITLVGSGEMLKRNAIPNSLPLKFVGYVKDGTKRFPTFILKKVKVLSEKTFPKYVDKLDKAMLKKGFRKVNDPDVLYRAYTDGNVVIDDVAPGNVGLNFFRLPKLIDFNLLTVPSWTAQGFKLGKGGKIISLMKLLKDTLQGLRTSKAQIPSFPLNVGWAPKLTIRVSHASDTGILKIYFPKRWDVINEGANPHGIWLLGKLGIPRTDLTNPGKGTKAEKARKLFADRPYQMSGEVTLEKPIATIGDVPDRSALSWIADRMGADGIIYNNIYDNGYNNNLVILSFKKFI